MNITHLPKECQMHSRDHHPPTPEQIDVLRWAASLGAITAEALALRLGVTPASARARLGVVRRRGLLSRERPLADGPALFTVTRAGLRASAMHGIHPCRITPGGANHLVTCAIAAAALERCYPDHRLIGERELRRDERDLRRPLASAVIGSTGAEGSRLHRPDLVLWPSDPDSAPVVVEVELTVKAPRRLVEICRAWARCRSIAGVLYLAPAIVQRSLGRALAEAHASEQIAVVPLRALPGLEGIDDGQR
jgi:hypothetical protein